jgi:MinD superfamily P-loop ATPase
MPVPQVDKSLCDGCGECGRFCAYHAIISFGKEPLFFAEMCHGCGGCAKVCPKRAISETDKRIGVIETMRSGNLSLIQGKLDVGTAMAPPLIRAVKARLKDDKIAILDAPPGTSCPVIATIRGADFVLLVTEPTPFGLSDLKSAIETVKELNIPFGVIINRMGSGDDRANKFCRDENIPALLEIPDDRRIAEAYSRGILMLDALPEYLEVFQGLFEKIRGITYPARGNE